MDYTFATVIYLVWSLCPRDESRVWTLELDDEGKTPWGTA